MVIKDIGNGMYIVLNNSCPIPLVMLSNLLPSLSRLSMHNFIFGYHTPPQIIMPQHESFYVITLNHYNLHNTTPLYILLKLVPEKNVNAQAKRREH